MTIEIRQLIIRASLTDEPKDKGPQTGAEARGGGNKNNQKAEIVREAVEQVMQILREEKER
ncbi:hypothetical protein IEN85_14150 [Pelagicoccus sp. NFK12]|uniref:Uncharacterized protein n=1 Tax=Pelagicoccus enzymogenes TaxID=2773457 RepID=A0A927FA43_9BACT|nr:DUF5908 family protein [Pelagicoccus enzymogenes]MBD5780640.1 hypothetical protein [Pelagicoccus enzymogenes]MDQ8198959.1 DUF5908 family protein [Pelagicoccus enzymogenes]